MSLSQFWSKVSKSREYNDNIISWYIQSKLSKHKKYILLMYKSKQFNFKKAMIILSYLLVILFWIFIHTMIYLPQTKNYMDMEKLFGSKAKVDILKYLLFKRQWISMRALEWDLERTFPAIKKQIDSLLIAWVLDIDKSKLKWSITLNEWFSRYIKGVFMYALVKDIQNLTQQIPWLIHQHFFWKTFGWNLDMDVVLIYDADKKKKIDWLKKSLSDIFKNYFIDQVALTTMSHTEREQRYRLADKFVLTILREKKEF